MRSISLHVHPDGLKAALEKLKVANSDIVLLFTSLDMLENSLVVEDIRKTLPNARVIGCSTSGEMGENIEDNSISMMGLKFDHTRFACAAVELGQAADSHAAGRRIAESLAGDGLKSIFVLSPGLNVNGSEITDGIKENLPPDVFVSGGLAGDGTNFKRTCVVLDDGISDKQAVAFALYGDKIHVHGGSSGGWKPFGPLRRVTKVEKNVLYELDGKPALELYKQYLGDKVKDLPGSGLLYPFAIMSENKFGQKGLVRTILGIDEAANSLTFAGNIEVGSMVSLMHATTEELAEGARAAAMKALQGDQPSQDSAAICVSCVGRKILMGEDTQDELDAVRDEFQGTPLAGFYSYGEISHHDDTGRPELHNQTMTITYISEHD